MSLAIILSSLAMGSGLFITWRIHGYRGMRIVVDPQANPQESTLADKLPMISVIIPARNEQRNIRRCIQALQCQNYPRYEIIVVDDRSTDETPQILAELAKADGRLRVIQGEVLPSGWAGKPHALFQGAAASQGEWLCFMDADTFATPDLLSSTYLMALKTQADMFSIFTEQELGTFWEKVVLPLVFLGLSFGFPPERVNDTSKPDAIANGQFILIKRQVYEQIGGHASVRERIDEDKAIAIVVKRAGYRLILADGRKVAQTRMYTSLQEMWEGWTKNIYLGMLDRLWLLSLGAILGLMASIVLPLWLLGGLFWLASGGALDAGIVVVEVVILWGFLFWQRLRACQAFGISNWFAITFPLGALIFTAMMMASSFNVISGRGVSWKGRRYH